MIKGLSEYEKFKVMRPIIGPCQYDDLKMPVRVEFYSYRGAARYG